MALNLAQDWLSYLAPQFDLPYMQELKAFLAEEKQAKKVIYPHSNDCYNALNSTPFDQVKVVILGQDPYHGPGQAHGLSFSVLPGVKIPPSLVNIYKELETDLGVPVASHGFLDEWAKQGVLLLNSVLTVEASKAGSHQGKGWERFTDEIIQLINQHHQGVVFILWGSYAQKKGANIDQRKHLVLKSVHPSPLSSYRGFFGSRPFSQANNYLEANGKTPIDWSAHLASAS